MRSSVAILFALALAAHAASAPQTTCGDHEYLKLQSKPRDSGWIDCHSVLCERPWGPRLVLSTGATLAPDVQPRVLTLLREAARGAVQPTIAIIVTAMLAPAAPSVVAPPAKAAEVMAVEAAAEAARRRDAAEQSARQLASAYCGGGEDTEVNILTVDAAKDSLEEMEAAIKQAHCIWVFGGNTFWLLHHMRRSGLDELVRKRVSEGALYVGQSAGAIVAGQSILPARWKGWDDPTVVTDRDWSRSESLAALGLVADRSFFPHHQPCWEPLVAQRRDELGHTVVTLREEGGAFVSGMALREVGGDS